MTSKVTEQPMVTITASAVENVLNLMSKQGLEGYYLRLFVEGVGCSGYQCGMAFSEEPREGDVVINSNGMRVLVDPYSLVCLNGAIVDYVDTHEGADFRIDNPNAAPGSACNSCGKSCG